MDSPVTERLFEETLTKAQMKDMLTKKIRPVHWVDGIVSYFRIQKIIDLLQEENKPLNPNLDVAIAVLSGGKAKIYNQSHKDFCRDIKTKMEDLEGQTDEDLQQPVECLVPGCFPIGPECESLGISGDILFNRNKSFPEAIDPASITNRVMFELSEYVTRMKESYKTLAGWIKKIMGWGDEYDLTPKMVEDWCTMLMRDTKKKKKSSLSLAQKYLLEKFQFPGLVPNITRIHGNEDIMTPSSKHPDDTKTKTKTKSDNGDTSFIDVEFSGDEAEDDKEQDMDISGFLKEGTEVDNTPSKKKVLVSSPPDDQAEEGLSPGKDGDDDANDNGDEIDRGNDKELSDGEENEAGEASTSQFPRRTSSRSAAKAALIQISTPEQKRSKEAVVGPAGKKETRQSTSSKNTTRRAPAKKTISRGQEPARSSNHKRKRESSDESSYDDEQEDDEEDDDEEEEEDEDDDSSIEEGEVKTPRSKSVHTGRIKREIAEATKLFTSMSKVVNTLKKEMRIAMDYLESETAKICKNLQKAEKKLDDVMKMVKLDKAQSDSEDEEVEDSSEEEEIEEEKPVRLTRRSQKTKKITVQVKPGVKAKLKKPLVRVTRLTRRKGKSRTPPRTAQSTKATKTRIKVSRQNAPSITSPRTSRSTRSGDSPKQGEGEIKDFDKDKLFSSKVSVSLMKISEDVVKQALGKNEKPNAGSDEELSGSLSGRGHSSTLEKSAKKSARKNPSVRGPESKMDSEDEDEMDDDDDDEDESVEGGGLSNDARAKSGRFRKQKNFPRKTANLQSAKNRSSKSTSESSKIAAEELDRMDSDNANVEEDSMENSTSRKFTRRSSRKSTNGTLEDKDKEVDSSYEKDKQPTTSLRSSRSRQSKPDTKKARVDADKEEESSRRSWRGRVNSPIENEEVVKPSAIDSPYSGSEDDDDIPKKSGQSAFGALAAGMSSFGDWRGAPAKEKVKKRSLNAFVQMLNSPKRRKMDSGKKASPRIKDSDQSNDKSSEEDNAGLIEEENNDHDSLEKKTVMELEKGKSSTTQEEGAEPHDDEKINETSVGDQENESAKDFEMESQGENEDREQNHSKDSSADKELSEGIPGVEKTRSKDSDEEFEQESERDDDFPGDSIVGKRIRHRCSMAKHGLFKWYGGKVVHKSTASELLKLDEEQFGHLNNLYTFYTVKYDDHEELQAKALEYDWNRENLKLCS